MIPSYMRHDELSIAPKPMFVMAIPCCHLYRSSGSTARQVYLKFQEIGKKKKDQRISSDDDNRNDDENFEGTTKCFLKSPCRF